MHYARRGEITPEMRYVALREGVDVELVRSEVAARIRQLTDLEPVDVTVIIDDILD